MPVNDQVLNVAPEIFDQVELSGDDCHWKVIPDVSEYPASPKVKGVAPAPMEGDTDAVPATGVPVQFGAAAIVTL